MFISVVMPVFDTGALLLDSVRSIVAQTLFAEADAPEWELLVVDDASTDPVTRDALATAASWSPRIRILANARRRGPAGARNTGVFAARGTWVGFLDSDDLWYPGFLASQFEAMVPYADAPWRAASFHVGDASAVPRVEPLALRSPCLHRHVAPFHERGDVARLERPVEMLLDCGCLQIMTVQVRRDVLVAAGGFDEGLPSAEDYDLWLRLAVASDLHVTPCEAGVYRMHPKSLTRSGKPMYFAEDRMLRKALGDPRFAPFRDAVRRRLAKVYASFAYHFRRQRRFAEARAVATRLVALRPLASAGWKQLVAALLRRA